MLRTRQVDRALSSRFALVNVWHHFGPAPVQADPMAFALWGTYGPRDVMTKRLTFPHRVGETYQGLYSPQQRWALRGWGRPGRRRDPLILPPGRRPRRRRCMPGPSLS